MLGDLDVARSALRNRTIIHYMGTRSDARTAGQPRPAAGHPQIDRVYRNSYYAHVAGVVGDFDWLANNNNSPGVPPCGTILQGSDNGRWSIMLTLLLRGSRSTMLNEHFEGDDEFNPSTPVAVNVAKLPEMLRRLPPLSGLEPPHLCQRYLARVP
jgi:hypothetical protein